MEKKPSNRRLKVGENIKRELSHILSKELNEPQLENLYITVSEVKMSADLKYADVYIVSILAQKITTEKLVLMLNDFASKIRNLLNKKIKLRYSPEIKFKYDHSYDQAHKLNLLLNE